MVNVVENIFCISDIWEMFCFPSRLPRTFRWTEPLEGTMPLVQQAALGAMAVTPEPAHHWGLAWQGTESHRGTCDRSPALQGH